ARGPRPALGLERERRATDRVANRERSHPADPYAIDVAATGKPARGALMDDTNAPQSFPVVEARARKAAQRQALHVKEEHIHDHALALHAIERKRRWTDKPFCLVRGDGGAELEGDGLRAAKLKPHAERLRGNRACRYLVPGEGCAPSHVGRGSASRSPPPPR